MANPQFSAPFVAFKLGSGTNAGKIRLAIVVRLQADQTADLFVFGRPADGATFTAGPAYVLNVPRSQIAFGNGTWAMLPPPGETRDPPFPGTGDLS